MNWGERMSVCAWWKMSFRLALVSGLLALLDFGFWSFVFSSIGLTIAIVVVVHERRHGETTR